MLTQNQSSRHVTGWCWRSFNKHVQRKVFINGTTLILWVIILGVILKPEKPHVILGTGEETTFTAEVLPAIGPKGNVKIRFHRNDRVHAPLGNLMLAIFWKPGRWGGPLCLAYLLRMQRTSLGGGARCWWWTLESESRCLGCSYDQTLLCSPGQAVHSGTATLALLSPLPPMGNIQKFLGKEGSNLWWLGIITMRTTNFPSQSTVPWKRGIIWCDCQHESILDSYVELILPNFVFKVYCESWGRKWSQLCLV